MKKTLIALVMFAVLVSCEKESNEPKDNPNQELLYGTWVGHYEVTDFQNSSDTFFFSTEKMCEDLVINERKDSMSFSADNYTRVTCGAAFNPREYSSSNWEVKNDSIYVYSFGAIAYDWKYDLKTDSLFLTNTSDIGEVFTETLIKQ